MWRGRIFCSSFCGCKTRCSLNALARPLSLTGERQQGSHWASWREYPVILVLAKVTLNWRRMDQPAGFWLTPKEWWGGEGQRTESRLPTTHKKHEAGEPERTVCVAALWRTLNTSMITIRFLVYVSMTWDYQFSIYIIQDLQDIQQDVPGHILQYLYRYDISAAHQYRLLLVSLGHQLALDKLAHTQTLNRNKLFHEDRFCSYTCRNNTETLQTHFKEASWLFVLEVTPVQ